MNTIDVNSITLRYELVGEGPWLTLSHSLTCDLSMWDELTAALKGKFRILRYDARGHGGSSAPAGAYRFEQMVADVLGLWDALGIASSHFAGVSMGGMIGQHLALAAPQRLGKLIIANSTSRIPPEAAPLWDERIAIARQRGCDGLVEATLARWFTPAIRAARPDMMARVGALIRNTPAAGYIGCADAIRRLDITAFLPGIAAPTLVIAGAEDPGTPPAMSQTIADAIPGARYEVIADASHLACLEHPDTFARLVADFLAQPAR